MVSQLRDGTIEFSFFCTYVNQVMLTGEFNGWNTDSMPMNKNPDGWWRYRIKLNPGCYQFRYVGDGKWYTDYAAFGLTKGPYGLNSVVKVDRLENKVNHTDAARVIENHIDNVIDGAFFHIATKQENSWNEQVKKEQLNGTFSDSHLSAKLSI
ncbi:MAG: glycogen-binding domain-containing protein [Planctomycetota bacterium]|jgi:1,4-alpha-glucan branching enzyme